MPVKPHNTCSICGKEQPLKKLTVGELLRPKLFNFIRKQKPDFAQDNVICTACLDAKRSEYIIHLLKEDRREITHLENEVAKSIRENETLSDNLLEEFEEELTLGDQLADRVAEFGGSWKFVIIFFAFIAAWAAMNLYLLTKEPFDPYPFILLNLILSCLAAIQAPIIMMSQNRQEDRDRLRAQHDYQVNLKAELEIQHLNEKIDLLLKHQWQNLMQIQQMQVDILEEIREKR